MPQYASFIESVCKKYGFSFPKMGIIDDNNPTAFTYGSTRNNARIVITAGILKYLSEREALAVIGHEMGHIKNYDFIIMSVAATLVQILYELYVVLSRSKAKSSSKKGGNLAWIGLVAYAFYIIGTYLLLYLSRVREYYADQFSSEVTNTPNLLIQALVKIAYGIVAEEDSQSSKRLLEATRSLGVIDVKNAGFIGSLVYVSSQPEILAEVMSFDIVSPWAKILELSSTHPLTGKRILALGKIAQTMQQVKLIDFEAAYERLKLDKQRLYHNFILEVCIYFLPLAILVVGFLIGGIGGGLAGFAIGSLIKINYRMQETQPKKTTILEQMRNVYASPMKGERVVLDGNIVGRGVAGFALSEDMMLQDKTGLIYIDYQSIWGFIGDIFFAIGKVKKLIGEAVQAEGWFFRGIAQSITLTHVYHGHESVSSHPKAWGIILNVITLIIGVLMMVNLRYPLGFV